MRFSLGLSPPVSPSLSLSGKQKKKKTPYQLIDDLMIRGSYAVCLQGDYSSEKESDVMKADREGEHTSLGSTEQKKNKGEGERTKDEGEGGHTKPSKGDNIL
jgi:hypothetical protein